MYPRSGVAPCLPARGWEQRHHCRLLVQATDAPNALPAPAPKSQPAPNPSPAHPAASPLPSPTLLAGGCRCSHPSPWLGVAPRPQLPTPVATAGGQQSPAEMLRACVGCQGTSHYKGHGGHVPATQDKGGLQTSLCPSEASAQDAAAASWLVPAAAPGVRLGGTPAPGEQLWVPLPSITPEVKSRES